ncbi:MAG: efflux RND transporter periplasmic adaptor subunit [Planctomycetaceae bacterium]|nr:efflux RND transporter periplasmic adaptor subunit [Planctomycetaceae bacterium]
MSLSNRFLRLLGVVLGLAMLAAGVAGALFLSRPKPQPMPGVPVRPVKTMLVGGPVPTNLRRYPGKVQAARRVQLSFDVAGTIAEFPVVSGQQVHKGDVLARLDPRDYQNKYNAAKAREDERRINAARTHDLFGKGAASQQEVEVGDVSFEVAKADAAIARKALDDTIVRAPFDGVVAYIIAKQFQSVAAKDAVLSLQDPAQLEIVIQVPEQVIARTAPKEQGRTFTASFDFLPGRSFPMSLKEYTTEADPATQTYSVTLAMPAPKDVSILPGMSATVTIFVPPIIAAKDEGYLLPVTAVPANGQGQFYVWVVEPAREGLYTVVRHEVKVGPITKEYIVVTQGVAAKQRIVTAGAHLLENGQHVRLLAHESGGGT